MNENKYPNPSVVEREQSQSRDPEKKEFKKRSSKKHHRGVENKVKQAEKRNKYNNKNLERSDEPRRQTDELSENKKTRKSVPKEPIKNLKESCEEIYEKTRKMENLQNSEGGWKRDQLEKSESMSVSPERPPSSAKSRSVSQTTKISEGLQESGVDATKRKRKHKGYLKRGREKLRKVRRQFSGATW